MKKSIKKILVIDDEKYITHSIKEYLTDYEITTANNGLKGFEYLKNDNFDLIVTDIVMPEMEGMEFIFKMRKLNSQIPIIVMTGHPLGRNCIPLARSLDFVVGVIEKPYILEELFELIKELETQEEGSD